MKSTKSPLLPLPLSILVGIHLLKLYLFLIIFVLAIVIVCKNNYVESFQQIIIIRPGDINNNEQKNHHRLRLLPPGGLQQQLFPRSTVTTITTKPRFRRRRRRRHRQGGVTRFFSTADIKDVMITNNNNKNEESDSVRSTTSSTATTPTTTTTTMMTIDPLLLQYLRSIEYDNAEEVDDNEEYDEDDDGNEEEEDMTTRSSSSSSSLPHYSSVLLSLGGNLQQVSYGIQVWKKAFSKGRLPDPNDWNSIDDDDDNTNTNVDCMSSWCWPPQPLYDLIITNMIELQLPRFVSRHTELIPLILRSLLRITTKFYHEKQKEQQLEAQHSVVGTDDDEKDDEEYDYYFNLNMMEKVNNENNQDGEEDWITAIVNDPEYNDNMFAQTIVNEILMDEWKGVVNGVSILDGMFGYDHGLLQVQATSGNNNNDGNNSDNNKNMRVEQQPPISGYGFHDGIWEHSGWKTIPTLQQQISKIPKLKELIQTLGKRPTTLNSNRYDKFIPRIKDNQGMLGATYDPTIRDTINGITYSNKLNDMVLSEAILLVNRTKQSSAVSSSMSSSSSSNEHNDQDGSLINNNGGSSNVLRRLFLAKLVESKLLSYEPSGFTDIPSIPKRRKRRGFSNNKERLPSAPGGPIILCLDTSWSMCTGNRETLSKAVVLACVIEAHKQGRACQVVAFSSKNNIMETGILTPTSTRNRRGGDDGDDDGGLPKLLEFLSNSFGGGTDVTGAIKHLINQFDTNKDDVDSFDEMECADIVLISDGEIPDPPVSDKLMKQLDDMKTYQGVEIHGLLVGSSVPGMGQDRRDVKTSTPLSKICTQMHDFLLDFEAYGTAGATYSSMQKGLVGSSSLGRNRSRFSPPSSTLRLRLDLPSPHYSTKKSMFGVSRLPSRALSIFPLKARNSKYDFDEDDDDYFGGGGSGKRRGGNKGGKNRNRRYDLDDLDDTKDSESSFERTQNAVVKPKSNESSDGSFLEQVDEAIDRIRESSEKSVAMNAWNTNSLDEERMSEGSCWQRQAEITSAIAQVEEGLVERSEDARLVVLAMLAMEHVLLLGVPGTGKSVLGRRLSKLCTDGYFFQRLLTRFTTPEELFGPLSLRSLEQDEYRRVTTGFLPTASVAFLDEIFKANSAILNTLLTILNERKFDNAGGQEECPIKCVVGASNELPDSDELEALFDRFLIRKEVVPVSDDGIVQMLSMSNPGYSPCDTSDNNESVPGDANDNACVVFEEGLDEVIVALSSASLSVHIDRDVCELIRDLRTYLRDDQNIDISDRRLVKASHLLKISAASHGRKRVDPIDCMLLQHCFWQLPEQRAAVKEWLWNNLSPVVSASASSSISRSSASSVEQFRFLLDGLRQEVMEVVRRTSGDVTGDQGGRKVDIETVDSLREEIRNLRRIIQERQNDLLRHIHLLSMSNDEGNASNSFLWLDLDESQAMKQLLVPRAKATSAELEKTLSDVYALELSIQREGADSASVSNCCRLAVIEQLWEDGYFPDIENEFTEDELLNLGMKDAKAKYDLETFRRWKRARKKLQK